MQIAAVKSYATPLGLFILVVFVIWAHLWQLAEIPKGLYVDETSIGINAVHVAESGRDEYGEKWPIFFQAFGEYKNPLYIYASSFIFWLTSPSVFTLRLTSALFFFVFLAGLAALAWQLFRHALPVVLIVGAAAFLPWFFPISRIAFEVVSQLTVVVFAFLCLYAAYHRRGSSRARLYFAFFAGALLALSVYAYSTSRLLAFASLGTWALLYWREGKARVFAGILGFLLVLIPYGLFSLSHPGALTAHFQAISYVSNLELSLGDKVYTFARTYLYHLSPNFLLFTGDNNLRHGTGETGALFASVLGLSVVGIAATLIRRGRPDQKFIYFLALGLLVAPLPAALTLLDGGIATRTLLFGLLFILFAGYGVVTLMRYHPAIIVVAACILTGEAAYYLIDYFTQYPARSVIWFETYDLEGTLRAALSQSPARIIVSPNAHQSATNLAFYRAAIPNPTGVPIVLAPPTPAPSTCLIFFTSEDEAAVNASPLAFRDLTPPDSMAKLRCY